LKRIPTFLVLLGVLLLPLRLRADSIFTATLTGAQESPPIASTATGFGTVVLNAAQDMITVDLSWTGLVGGPVSAAHIHCCAPPGTNAGVLFPFVGVPSATSASIPEQTFGITSVQVAELEAGLMYINIHDSSFPGGEIRGQILPEATPESASLALLVFGLLFVMLYAAKTRGLNT
jgi:CHRD domain